MSSELRIIGLRGLPDITPGLDLASKIAEALKTESLTLSADDILVVTQKVVSKSEGRLVDLQTVTPSPFAEQFALRHEKDPRVVEVVFSPSLKSGEAESLIPVITTSTGWHDLCNQDLHRLTAFRKPSA